MNLNDYVILQTMWYYINSYNYTIDGGNFQAQNSSYEEQERIKNLKTERLLVGNLLEYYVIYYLIKNGINIQHDKNNPFKSDTGVDIYLVDKKINLFLKGTSSTLLGQVRTPLLNIYKRYGGYLLLAKISKHLVQEMKKIIEKYFKNGGKLSLNQEMIPLKEIESKIGKFSINVKKCIEIQGLLNINDYENNSIFVPYGEKFPNTSFTQNFKEGSYILKQGIKFQKLNDILK